MGFFKSKSEKTDKAEPPQPLPPIASRSDFVETNPTRRFRRISTVSRPVNSTARDIHDLASLMSDSTLDHGPPPLKEVKEDSDARAIRRIITGDHDSKKTPSFSLSYLIHHDGIKAGKKVWEAYKDNDNQIQCRSREWSEQEKGRRSSKQVWGYSNATDKEISQHCDEIVARKRAEGPYDLFTNNCKLPATELGERIVSQPGAYYRSYPPDPRSENRQVPVDLLKNHIGNNIARSFAHFPTTSTGNWSTNS